MGIVAYRDWTPGSFQDPTYQEQGAIPQLESWTPNVPRSLPMQPEAYFDNRLGWPDFYLANLQRHGYTLDELYPYPKAIPESFYAPAQPVRYDVYSQLAARARGANVAGAAPTRGIYTGVADIGE